MRKIARLILISIAIFTIAGCDTKKAYESEKTEESVQVDNTKKADDTTADKITGIDEKSAQQLVSERLDTSKYSTEKEDEITVDDKNYYVFKILQDGSPLSMGIAVDKLSGELSAYKEDKTIVPYSEFTLYDEAKDTSVNWEGTFKNDVATLELMPADSNSFEFSLTSKAGSYTVSGVAQASDKEAVYEEESGYKITFVNEGESIKIEERKANPSGTAFQGTYTK